MYSSKDIVWLFHALRLIIIKSEYERVMQIGKKVKHCFL